jgi:RND family efflux transporter MFP subunit
MKPATSFSLVLAAAAFVLAACGEKLPPPEKIDAGPRPVKALKVGAGGTAMEAGYSGEVRARVETTLGFRIGGKLVERNVDVGARVRPGQVLARLDPADLRLAATQAEANRALALAELRRTQELQAKNFISEAALDAKATAAAATEAQAALARNQAAYATLAADAPGVVAAVLAEPGQVVGAGQGVFRIARDGRREVAIAVPESRIAALKVGADGTVLLWDGRSFAGKVREIAPVADPATRTFAVRLALTDAPIDLPLGLSATVRFAVATAAGLMVPLAAIIQHDESEDAPAVWVIGADGTVSLRAIEIARYGDTGALVTSGLNEGETIVAAGAFKLASGEKVRIAQP